MSGRIIRVAAVQVEPVVGDVAGNLGNAEPLVARAAGEGAQLVVLPELFSAGYQANRALWRDAETADGPTVRWLRRLARRFAIHLGGGYALWDGDDVVNAFGLAGPDGGIVGTARKADAESYVFRRGRGEHVVDTALGRLGVGICADNQSVRLLREMQRQRVDLMLMPHASPAPAIVTRVVSDADIQRQHDNLAELASTYACGLGVPAILVNQAAPMGRMLGILGRLMDPAVFRPQGGSRIVDSDGTVVGALEYGQGVLVGDVVLDPARKLPLEPVSYGGWLTPGNPLVRRVLIPVDVLLGTASYRLHAGARRAAAASARQPSAARSSASPR